jgi:hypothetical protein
MNFSSYRDLQLDAERATLFGQVQGIPYLSNQFKLKKYLGLTDDEMKENEALWRAENAYEKFVDNDQQIGLKNIGIRAEPESMVNTDMDTDFSNVDVPNLGAGSPDAGAPLTPPGGPGGPVTPPGGVV